MNTSERLAMKIQRCPLSIALHAKRTQLILCILTLFILVRSEATLIKFKFSKPIVIGDVVICVVIGGYRAVAVSTNAETLWRTNSRVDLASSPNPFALTEGPGGSLLFQQLKNKNVFRMEPHSGRITRAFSLGGKDDVVSFDRSTETLFASNIYGDTKTQILESQTGRVLWKTKELNWFIGAHSSQLFVFSGRFRDEGIEQKLISNEIQSISKTTGKMNWKRSMPVSCCEAVLIWPYLAIEDNERITVFAAETGEPVREFDVNDWVIKIVSFESQLVYSTSILKSDVDQDMILHFCSLPELKEQKNVTLKQTRPSAVALWRDFILVGDNRGTACFRQTGEKVWEKGDMNRTDVIDGRIYFTDNPADIVRIGMIDVATGDERILYTESK